MLKLSLNGNKIIVLGVAVASSSFVGGIILNYYKKHTFDSDGYNKYGFDREGYDHDGFNKNGYNRDGYNKDGFNVAGYDEEGFNKDGYDKNGYDRDGYDRNGYDKDGYDVMGYTLYRNRKVYNVLYDRYNFDEEGYDKDGYDRDGYNLFGFNREGYDKCGYDLNGYDLNGYDKSGLDKNGFNRAGYNNETKQVLLKSQREKLSKSFAEFSKDSTDDLLNRTRKQLECILVYMLKVENCFCCNEVFKLRELIEICKNRHLVDDELVQRLYQAIKYCNMGSHFNDEKVEDGCVYFTLKTTEELLDFFEEHYMQ